MDFTCWGSLSIVLEAVLIERGGKTRTMMGVALCENGGRKIVERVYKIMGNYKEFWFKEMRQWL